jgi:hypothetical protein
LFIIIIIAEAEMAEAQFKRLRYSKCFAGREKRGDDQDREDTKTYICETNSFDIKLKKEESDDSEHLDVGKIKKEKESDKSETDSIDISNSIDSEAEPNKMEIISIKSANSSAASSPSAVSQKSRSSRISRGASPFGKQKTVVDMSNPLYKEPFKYGWKRELVFRASNDTSFKKMADIYYYTPKGKKVRSFREVAESRKYNTHNIYSFY